MERISDYGSLGDGSIPSGVTEAEVAELVDARDLKSLTQCGCGGSSPPLGTKQKQNYEKITFFIFSRNIFFL